MAQQKLEPDKKKNVRNKWTPDIIIDKSKEIFRKKGFELSMHDIARELNTRASSIYRHFESKRELWFAITLDDFDKFGKRLENVAIKHFQNNERSSKDLLIKTGQEFLTFANEDFHRFQLLFLYEPPKTENPGPYEQQCNPDSLMNLVKICEVVIKEEELHNIEAEELAFQLFSFVLGYAILISPINDYLIEKENFHAIRTEKFKDKMFFSTVEGILSHYK